MTATEKELKWLQAANFLAPMFSTCAKRQYFAFVLDVEGRVVGAGYNGAPPGVGHCTDGYCPRMQEGSPSGSSYDNCISIHAEENALLFSDRTARAGGTVVVNGVPCFGCAKKLAGAGIGRVVYLEDPTYTDWPRAEGILKAAGVIPLGVDPVKLLTHMAARLGRVLQKEFPGGLQA